MIRPLQHPAAGDVARHYGDLDPFYRELWGEHIHHGLWRTGREDPEEATLELVRHVADLAGIGRGDRVVDVGSGYGATARWLAEERGADVTAVTLSPVQHARAMEYEGRGSDGPRYLLGDWLENGESSESFDQVVAIESTEHMPDIDRAFAEMARVLKPAGRLVACVWLARENPAPWEVRHLLRPICSEGRLVQLLTASELDAMLRTHGLVSDGVRDQSRRVSRTWTICLRRAGVRLLGDRNARRFLFDSSQPERVFAKSLVRIRLAFAFGSLRYGIVRAVKE